MRVAIISKGSPDYLIDIVTDGVIRLLGRHNVHLDYNITNPLGQYSTFFEGFDLPNKFNSYDAEVLLASVRSAEAAKEWASRTGRPVAIIDGEDFDPIHPSQAWSTVYFKREYLKGRSYASNVKPLPFAAIPEKLPLNTVVSHPVFYKLAGSDFYRGLVAQALMSIGFGTPEHRLEKAEYNKRLMSSLVGVSVRGQGWDTYRYWEIPYFGVTLLSQRLEIVIPNDFIDGEEAVFWGDLDDLKRKLTELLDDQDRARAIGAAGRKACLERHLSKHRAKTVLEALV